MAFEYEPKADLYSLLRIEPTASPDDIRKAHRALIRELHPDLGGDASRAMAINAGRDLLLDPARRQTYDALRSAWFARNKPVPGPRTASRAAPTASKGTHHRGQPAPAQAPPARTQASTARTQSARRPQAPARAPQGSPARPQATSAAPTATRRQGLVTALAMRDVAKALVAGQWLRALGMYTATSLVDHVIERNVVDADQLAQIDALVAWIERENIARFAASVANLYAAYRVPSRPRATAPRARRTVAPATARSNHETTSDHHSTSPTSAGRARQTTVRKSRRRR